MKAVSFGFKTEPPRASYRDLVRIWQEADEIPLIADLWAFDHFVPLRADPSEPCLEGWTTLTALATQTRRARVGLLVAGNTYRHPAVLAKMAAALDIISDGRLEFGLGAGWHEPEHQMYGIPYGTTADRIRAMGEACQVVTMLWTQELSTFEGRYYSLTDARCEPKPVQRPRPPITIGGTGERLTLRIVARHADRWNFNGKSVDEFARLNAVLDEHCRVVGRDPSTIVRSVQRHIGDDFADAAAEVAEYVAAGAEHIIINPRIPLRPGVATRAAKEIIEPVLRAT
ncbi:MAG TPA: TIGR03560 family F420-dependent LLM class oxidoreductase [Candidatus Limnocylindrales bacterium]|nr:TIGR03560 family F420-dependent LLM class oxidoreductase [Candidatus Limnocylindrales bacterium]